MQRGETDDASESAGGSEHTFLLADLAGFTALTEAHGDQRAAQLATDFFATVRAGLREHGGEEVKTLGDAVLVRCLDAAAAVRLGLWIVRRAAGLPDFPLVRVGMHTGTAVERSGDWFGTAVNVAARIATVAESGEVLASAATRKRAGDLENVEIRERGSQRLRNVSAAVRLFAFSDVAGLTARRRVIDPVCRMTVDPAHAPARVRHGEGDEFFCSPECARLFAERPERFASAVS